MSGEIVPFSPPVGSYASFNQLAVTFSTRPDVDTPIDGRVEGYLRNVFFNGRPPTISGLAKAIGVNTGHLKQYINEYKSSSNTTDTYMGGVMAYAFASISEYIEEGLLMGSISPAAAKPMLSMLGFSDAPVTNNLTINMPVSQIDAKIAALIGEQRANILLGNGEVIDVEDQG